MTLESITYQLPSHWAGYLINGDATCFDAWDDGEVEQVIIDELIADIDLGGPVDVSEDSDFMTYHDARPYGVGASDCSLYTFLRAR